VSGIKIDLSLPGPPGVALAYIVVCALASGFGFAGAVPWAGPLALLLTLPAMVLFFPALYLLGAAAWALAGGEADGVHWQVVLVYGVVVGAAAWANLVLLRSIRQRRAEKAVS
jgi:hypothetical protein